MELYAFLHGYCITEYTVTSDTRMYFQFNSENFLGIGPVEDSKEEVTRRQPPGYPTLYLVLLSNCAAGILP